ncbi:uncharacterized protein LOC134184923 [Corticium candelabrum]|uniref:uncharacterized protein LOC134184923 n=1 Tax=Corticium candelabrum TaxID=121492 RepID=UPI002E302444|nr:uncharacterized protein LOC134184923 [Corticium candelabrum]
MNGIIDDDFELALRLDHEGETEGWSSTGSWMCCRKARFLKKIDSEKEIPLHIKSSRIYLDGIPIDNCLSLLINPDQRNAWDNGHFQLEKLDSSDYPLGTDLIYWKMFLPSVVKNRDMVQLTAYKMIGNACVIVYKQGDDSKKPESSEFIRMKTGLSYTILRPAEDDPSYSTLISTLGNNDYGGWLPNCLMGLLYSMSITNLCNRLLHAYHNQH